MGRIKLQLVKRTTRALMKMHGDEFQADFGKNKEIINKYTTVSNKKLRNNMAGYATKLVKMRAQE